MRRFLIYVSMAAVLLVSAVVDAQTFDGLEPIAADEVMPFDLDAWMSGQEFGPDGGAFYDGPCDSCAGGCYGGTRYRRCEVRPNFRDSWELQFVPDSILYKSYLAGVHEPRLSATGYHLDGVGTTWAGMLGARVGILRYGTPGTAGAQGFQIDLEGGALARLDSIRDLVATDFRFGVPLTFAIGNYQTKLAFYHLSSHLGDEFLLKTGMPRINFARDVIVWGHSAYWTDALRLYAEIGYAVQTDDGAEPWEFQFGAEYSSRCCTGPRGAPFAAFNTHLREEVNFGGEITVQAGWQWRGQTDGSLLRFGLQFYNGESSQYQFYDRFERQIGLGLWYDF